MKKNGTPNRMRVNTTAAIAAIFTLLCFLFAQAATAATVNIDLNTTNQTIRGFGGMNFPRWIGTLTDAQVDTAFGNGSGQIGLTIMRIDVPPDSGNWSGEVAAAQRAINNHGAIVLATPWSPPASMKTNNDLIGGELRTDAYGDYADYLSDFADYMSSNGASLYAISIQNEPDWLPDYESCGWNTTQMSNFLNNNASVIPTRVLAPETVHYKSDYVNAVASSSQCDIIGVHAYGGSITYYSGKQYWQTEHFTSSDVSGNLWPDALEVGKEIHDCMTANMNAYIWWYIRRSYGPIDESGNVTKRGYVMSHFAKFARPGYIKVDATASPQSGVYVTAYKSGSTLVIVALNQNSSSQSVTFSVSGGTVSSYTKYETTSSNNVANMGSVGSTNTLAANSMNTFVGTTGPQQTLTVSSTAGGSVTTPGEGNFNYSPGSYATITATADLYYHFVNWTGTAVDAGKVADPDVNNTTVLMDANYTVMANFEADPPTPDVKILGSWASGTSHAKENGSSRGLILIAHAEHSGTVSLDSVTYGGQTMTKVIERTTGGTGYQAYVAAFILDEAGVYAATSGTFSPSWSTTPENVSYGSVFLGNVNQTTSIGASASNSATSGATITTPSALATGDGDFVIDAVICGNVGDYGMNNGFTKPLEQDMSSSTGADGYKFATGVDETPSATYTGTMNRQAIIGFVVQTAKPSTCDDVQTGGFGLDSDLSGDCYVDWQDLDVISGYWLNTDCGSYDDCEGADFEPTDGTVDFLDFGDFAEQWMQCNDPQDTNCVPNW